MRALVYKYGISYRDLAEMMQERGVMVDHTTSCRWVQRYAPEIERRVHWYQGHRSPSWRVDEAYLRVARCVETPVPCGRQDGTADRFHAVGSTKHSSGPPLPGKALKTMRSWPPISITTDKLGSYHKRSGACSATVICR